MKIPCLKNSPRLCRSGNALGAYASNHASPSLGPTPQAAVGIPANWNPNTVPGATDTVIITNAGVTVSLNAATTIGAIILGTNGAEPSRCRLAGQTLALNGT